MINLRFGNDDHILVSVPKRRVEPISTQEETQVEEEPQHSTFQHTNVNNQAAASAENDDLAPIGKDVATSITSV